MKKDIHPKYNNEFKITCSCGNSFVTGSTLLDDGITVDICSKCHPFYTGEQKLLTLTMLLESMRRLEKSKKMSFTSKKEKMAKRREKMEKMASTPATSLSLRDMLANAKISK